MRAAVNEIVEMASFIQVVIQLSLSARTRFRFAAAVCLVFPNWSTRGTLQSN